MMKSDERKRAQKSFISAFVLILIFAIFTLVIYNRKQDNSYSSLNLAVSKVSKGGSVDATYGYKGGLFVFIKDSSSKNFGYFYKKNDKWYNRKSILSVKYNLDNKFEIITYYVKEPKYYFIRVNNKQEEVKTIVDSNKSNYSVLEIVENDKLNNIYFAGSTTPITTSYYLEINGEKYNLENYNSTKMIR